MLLYKSNAKEKEYLVLKQKKVVLIELIVAT